VKTTKLNLDTNGRCLHAPNNENAILILIITRLLLVSNSYFSFYIFQILSVPARYSRVPCISFNNPTIR